jgi:hypothetical protein
MESNFKTSPVDGAVEDRRYTRDSICFILPAKGYLHPAMGIVELERLLGFWKSPEFQVWYLKKKAGSSGMRLRVFNSRGGHRHRE